VLILFYCFNCCIVSGRAKHSRLIPCLTFLGRKVFQQKGNPQILKVCSPSLFFRDVPSEGPPPLPETPQTSNFSQVVKKERSSFPPGFPCALLLFFSHPRFSTEFSREPCSLRFEGLFFLPIFFSPLRSGNWGRPPSLMQSVHSDFSFSEDARRELNRQVALSLPLQLRKRR